MPASDILKRLEAKASLAEDMIEILKKEVCHIKQVGRQQNSDKIVTKLKQENEELKIEIERWKNRLIQAEKSFGRPQIPMPDDTLAAREVENQKYCKLEAEIHPISANTAEKKPKERKSEVKERKNELKKAAPAEKCEDQPIDVGRLDFRIGLITKVEKHPDADSLYVEQIDVGEEKRRTVVSGLVKHVPIQELENRLVVVLCNLKPAKMRGITSEAMVMCASTQEKVEILIPPAGSLPGDQIHVEGYQRVPDPVLNPKKKIFEIVAPDLKTNDAKVATYKGAAFTVPGKGVVLSSSLVGVNIK